MALINSLLININTIFNNYTFQNKREEWHCFTSFFLQSFLMSDLMEDSWIFRLASDFPVISHRKLTLESSSALMRECECKESNILV